MTEPYEGSVTTEAESALLLDARRASDVLGISQRTLFTITKSGRLPVIRIGRLIRYHPSDLAEFVASCREACE